MKSSTTQLSLFLSLGVVAYISLVALIMSHGEAWFGNIDNTVFGPIAMLMLFSLSAAIVGGLVVGFPAYRFFSGQKPEAVRLLLSTIGWLAIETALIFLTVAVTRS